MLWVLQAECGDYYCGCGGGHIVAITDDENLIPVLKERAEALADTYGKEPRTYTYKRWIHGINVREIEVNTVLEERQ